MFGEVCFLTLVYPIIELMFCTNCHEEIKESTDRCPACGSEKIVNNGEAYGLKWDINSTNPNVRSFLALFLTLALLAILGVIWSLLPKEYQYGGSFLPFLIVCATILIGAIIYYSIQQAKYSKRIHDSTWHETEGTVIDYREASFITKTHHEIIEFSVKGKKYRHVAKYGGDKEGEGKKRRIVYDPHNPFDSEIVGNHRNIEIIAVCAFMIILIAIGTFALMNSMVIK